MLPVLDLFTAAWGVVSASIQNSLSNATEAASSVSALVPELLQQFSASLEKGTAPGNAAHDLLLSVVRTTLDQCAALLQAEEVEDARVSSLVGILDKFGELVFSDEDLAKVGVLSMSRYSYRSLANSSILEC